jgi:hypothetical protein
VVDCEANRRIVFFAFLDFMGERENCSYLEGSLLSHGSYAYFGGSLLLADGSLLAVTF